MRRTESKGSIAIASIYELIVFSQRISRDWVIKMAYDLGLFWISSMHIRICYVGTWGWHWPKVPVWEILCSRVCKAVNVAYRRLNTAGTVSSCNSRSCIARSQNYIRQLVANNILPRWLVAEIMIGNSFAPGVSQSCLYRMPGIGCITHLQLNTSCKHTDFCFKIGMKRVSQQREHWLTYTVSGNSRSRKLGASRSRRVNLCPHGSCINSW